MTYTKQQPAGGWPNGGFVPSITLTNMDNGIYTAVDGYGGGVYPAPLTFTGLIDIQGNMVLTGNLTSSGANTFGGTNVFTGNITSSGTNTFSGTTVFGSSATISFGSTPATAGVLRLSNNTAIESRNAANTQNINMINTDNSNNVNVGDLAYCNQLDLLALNDMTFQSNSFAGTIMAYFSASTGSLNFTTTSAVYGVINIPNNVYINARNAANSADIYMIGTNSSNQVVIADNGSVVLASGGGGATVPGTFSASGAATFGGAVYMPTKLITSNYTVDSSGQDFFINCNSGSGSITITLPNANNAGRILIINGGTNATSPNVVIVHSVSSQNILVQGYYDNTPYGSLPPSASAAVSYTIQEPSVPLRLISTGTAWVSF